MRPAEGWNTDPFKAIDDKGKITGLGSNDAGGSVVTLLAVFEQLYEKQDLEYNLVFAATAEEEVSGMKGIESILPELPEIDLAVIGEPTDMQMAIAEKGLLVLDCRSYGKAGHAGQGRAPGRVPPVNERGAEGDR